MTRYKLRTHRVLLAVSFLLTWLTPSDLYGQHDEPATPSAITPTDRYTITGTVNDATMELLLTQMIYQIDAAESEKDLRSTFKVPSRSQPVPNIEVTLRSQSVTQTTTTDSQGRFEFTGLPGSTHNPQGKVIAEAYEVSAQIPLQPSASGAKRIAIAKQQVKLDQTLKEVKLDLHNESVRVRGRITDIHGQPIAGAKMTAILDWYIPESQRSDTQIPPRYSAVSSADGSYELQGMTSMHAYSVAGYLTLGTGPRQHVDIHVEADGFTQNTEDVPEVLLLTEDALEQGRRLQKAFNQLAQRFGGTARPEIEGLTFPVSYANTITGIDIVLDADSDVQ